MARRFPFSRPCRILPGLAAFVLSACVTSASTPLPAPRTPPSNAHSGGPIAAWPLADLASSKHPMALLRTPGGPVGVLPTRTLQAAWNAGLRVIAAADGELPEMLVADGDLANAFAFYQDGKPKIALNYAMLHLIGDDEAAWAALIGHELAHVNLHHQEVRTQRQARDEATSNLLGIAMALVGLPLGGAVSDGVTELISRGYSRDDERQADRTGVEYMVAAAYDPQGAIRLQEHLARAGGKDPLPFLGTHPQSSERIETMRALVREIAGKSPPDK